MLIDGTKRKEENTMIGGQPSTMMTGTSNMAQTGTKGATSSGGFTNLNKYLSANQGANNQTINKLNTTAQTSAKAAQDAITGAKTIGTSAQQNLEGLKKDQDFVSSSLNDPLKTDISRFSNLRTSFNANPTQELNKFNDATAQANQVRGSKANELQNLTTGGGLTDWLRSQRQTPRYSQGSQSLDKFLIKGTDEGAKTLQNIGTQATQLQQEPTEFNELRSGIQSRSQALNPNLMSAEQIANATNQRLAQERQALMDYQKNQGERIDNPTDLKGDSGLIARPTGTTLQAYLMENDTGDMVNRFTPEQIAQYTALSRMAGVEPSEILAQNETAYNDRNARTQQLTQQYASESAAKEAEARAAWEAQAQAEQQRQQQLRQLLAILIAAAGGGGGNMIEPSGATLLSNFAAGA